MQFSQASPTFLVSRRCVTAILVILNEGEVAQHSYWCELPHSCFDNPTIGLFPLFVAPVRVGHFTDQVWGRESVLNTSPSPMHKHKMEILGSFNDDLFQGYMGH